MVKLLKKKHLKNQNMLSIKETRYLSVMIIGELVGMTYGHIDYWLTCLLGFLYGIYGFIIYYINNEE